MPSDMKHLVLYFTLLITAPAITCSAQATFKQTFINMPLASEPSLGQQPIGIPLSRTGSGLVGVGFMVAAVPLVLGGASLVGPAGEGNYLDVAGGAILIALGSVSFIVGFIVFDKALARKE